jgi:hemolysin D
MNDVDDTGRPARALLWALALCVLSAVAWACLGEVDVVAVAPGRVVAVGHTKTVQAPEAAVVRVIRVADGDAVRAGQVLVELDATAPRAELARLADERLQLAADAARLRALLAAAHDGPAPPLDDSVRRRYARERREYLAALAGLDAERREAGSAVAASAARVAELAAGLPLVTEEAEAHRQLMDRGVVPRVHWLAVERERIAIVQRLAAARAERDGHAARRHALAARRARLVAEYGARWAAELAATGLRLAAVDEAAAKAARRLELATVVAPVAGRVQQLALHGAGAVVAAAQPLMRVVPDAAAVEIEALVANRDIGFVREGQRVAVKVDTFDFTRYGTLSGRVASLSRDAVDDERLGPSFAARVALEADALDADGQRLVLGPGMLVSAEFALGRRRVVEFLLSPLVRRGLESGRER